MGSLSWFIEGAKWVHRSGSLKEQSRWRRSKGEISSDDGKQSEKKHVLESFPLGGWVAVTVAVVVVFWDLGVGGGRRCRKGKKMMKEVGGCGGVEMEIR